MKTRSPDKAMSSPFVSHSVVRFNHTDPASYVFFPRYFEMIHAAVEDWFTIALGTNYADIVNVDRIGLPTAKIECEFLHPSRLGDTVELAVYLKRIGTSSITVHFVGSVAGLERLRATSVIVNISLQDGRPRPLSAALRIQLEAYAERQGDIPPAVARRQNKP